MLAGDPATARTFVVAIPGALTTVEVYAPLAAWADRDTAVLAYRFPGLDGRPLEDRVNIRAAGQAIAEAVGAFAPDQVRLVGMSAGAAVALETARNLAAPDVRVALISPALPAPGVALAGLVGAGDMAEAAARAGTWELRALFAEYYRTLLYGRGHFRDPVLAAESARQAQALRDLLILPGEGRARSQVGNLLVWTLGDPSDLAGVRVDIFTGAEDPLFPLAAVRRLAARLPQATVRAYPRQGHLLAATVPGLYDDIRRALER